MAKHPVPVPSGLGALIRTAREERGLSQHQLAGHIGRHQSHISSVELGWGRTDLRTLERWAAGLGCRWALIPLEDADGDD